MSAVGTFIGKVFNVVVIVAVVITAIIVYIDHRKGNNGNIDYKKEQDSLSAVIKKELDSLLPLSKKIDSLQNSEIVINNKIDSNEQKVVYIYEKYDSIIPVINSYDVQQLTQYFANYQTQSSKSSITRPSDPY